MRSGSWTLWSRWVALPQTQLLTSWTRLSCGWTLLMLPSPRSTGPSWERSPNPWPAPHQTGGSRGPQLAEVTMVGSSFPAYTRLRISRSPTLLPSWTRRSFLRLGVTETPHLRCLRYVAAVQVACQPAPHLLLSSRYSAIHPLSCKEPPGQHLHLQTEESRLSATRPLHRLLTVHFCMSRFRGGEGAGPKCRHGQESGVT